MVYTLHKYSLDFTQADLQLEYTRERKDKEKVDTAFHTKNGDRETLVASF